MDFVSTAYAINALYLKNFRNYSNVIIDFNTKAVVIVGANGNGKTNILEAISLFTPGRGLRNATLEEMQNLNAKPSPFMVKAELQSPLGIIDLRTYIELDALSKLKRKTLIDNQVIKTQGSLGKYLSIIWYTPQVNSWFFSDKNYKRRFLDRLVYNFYNNHLSLLADFEQAVRERNKVIRTSNSKWSNALEEIMAQKAIAVTAARMDFITKLNLVINSNYNPFQKILITLNGEVEEIFRNNNALQAEEILKQKFYDMRLQDSRLGVTTIGIHKSKLNILQEDKSISDNIASTGEQKYMLLSIILCYAYLKTMENGISPILLLDEILVHLDKQKRDILIHKLLSLKSQFFITSVDLNLFQDFTNNFQFLEVADNSEVKRISL